MTKTEATKRARRILSGGHFANSEGAWVLVDGDRVQLYATCGRLPHGEMVKQLAQAVIDRELDREMDGRLKC